MPFNDKRNSRDDKSGNPRRSTPPSFASRNSYRDDNNSRSNRRSSSGKPSFSPNSDKPFRGSPKWREEGTGNNRFVERGRGQFPDDRQRGDDRPRFGSEQRDKSKGRPFGADRPKFSSGRPTTTGDRPFNKDSRNRFEGDDRRKASFRKRSANTDNPNSGTAEDQGLIRLNRYIANAGICSRRKADELIEAGVITVNGSVVTELGTKVDPAKDDVRYNGERLRREKLVYVLLNKPKDYITTMDDPQERRTVMHLVAKASQERIYPVGRLDRNTMGLLLMTNDGNLAEKLAHPRNNISKIYHVELSRNLSQGDLNKIAFGLELEDGVIKPDDISYVAGGSKREIGIQIHSGKNRIVRRIFEHLGYEVIKLDRVVYAHLTKKDLPRGRWRYLTDKEIIQLKHFTK